MRIRLATTTAAAAAAAGTLIALTAVPAQAAEYTSALKIRGVQYDAPGSDSTRPGTTSSSPRTTTSSPATT